MDEMTKAVLAAWRDRFPTNAYAWPGAPESFAAEAVRVALAAQPAAPVGEPVGEPVDVTNHHNALKCPYCNPQGLQFAAPPPCTQKVREAFTPQDAWDELVNKDDRTSPEEYPDHCLISFEELQDYILRAALSTNPGEQE